MDILDKQAVVNPGLKFILKYQKVDGSFESYEYLYPNGIVDHLNDVIKDTAFTEPCNWTCERKGKDSPDRPEYKVKMQFVKRFHGFVMGI